jgi:alpha-ketoglutarate-dependent taurine dioxygenase
MSALALIVTRLSGALGAELSGLDLSQPLRPHDLAALRSAQWV